jgi:hypothetical protein
MQLRFVYCTVILQNPGNLYVSESEESSEDDDVDEIEEAFSSPGGHALSPGVSVRVLQSTIVY